MITIDTSIGYKKAKYKPNHIAVIRNPLLPSNAQMAGFGGAGADGVQAMRGFIGMIGKFAEFKQAGKMTDEAYASLNSVIVQLGKRNKNGNINLAMARGAGEQLGLAIKLVEDHGAILKGFEFKQAMFNGKNNFIGNRYFDIIVEINGQTRRIESKAWEPIEALPRLIDSIGGRIVKEGEEAADLFKTGGQFQKDFIDAMVAQAENLPVKPLWQFDGRSTPEHVEGYIDGLVDYVRAHPNFRDGLFKQSGVNKFLPDLEDEFKPFKIDRKKFIDDDLRPLLAAIFGVSGL